MFTTTDYDKLQQIMAESPQKKELLTRLLESHRMDISTISHEIRNPLTLVYSTLQLIESQHPEVLTFHHWEGMRQDIEYMKQLLEQLSSYNNGERLECAATDARTFLRKIALSFASTLVDSQIEFISRIPATLPSISIDPMKMKQVLLNLLKNAKDAVLSCPDRDNAAISLTAAFQNQQVVITISDTGCGIAPEDLSTIFEPFITHKQNGTGLGLAIAKRIASAHHGSLTVESVLDKGTVFTLTLPVQQDA